MVIFLFFAYNLMVKYMKLYAFILTSLAGFSTLIGALIILFKNKKEDNIIIKSLAFASGVMIMVSISDLIPNSYDLFLKNYNFTFTTLIILIAINIGIILSKSLNKFIPNNDNKLYRVGILSMITIILHNIPEGIATYITNCNNTKLGLSLTIAIAAHNIPEGISIAIPIYFATKSKIKAFLYTFISGISELFGAILSYLFLEPFITDNFMAFLYSIIAGIMIYLSITELLKTSLNYNKKIITYIFSGVGVVFILINHLIFG